MSVGLDSEFHMDQQVVTVLRLGFKLGPGAIGRGPLPSLEPDPESLCHY